VAADGDVEVGLGLGLTELAPAAKKAPQALLAPTKLSATALVNGTIIVECDKVAGARAYLVDRSFDPVSDTSWTPVGGGTTRRRYVHGLPPGQKIWFRMAAIGRAGQGPWSTPLMAVVG
jgi:hypothetical protein